MIQRIHLYVSLTWGSGFPLPCDDDDDNDNDDDDVAKIPANAVKGMTRLANKTRPGLDDESDFNWPKVHEFGGGEVGWSV